MMKKPDKQPLIKAFTAMDVAISRACDELANTQPDQILLYQTTPVYKQDEDQIIGQDYGVIETTTVDKNDWLTFIEQAIRNIYGDDGHSTRIIKRFPGIIVYDRFPSKAIEKLEALNRYKQALRQVITATELNSTQRHHWVKEHIPQLVPLYAYRQIPLLTGPVQAVYFNWGSRPTTKVLTKDECINVVNKLADIQPPEFSREEWLATVDSHIASLRRSDFATYKYKYTQKVAPHCRIMKNPEEISPEEKASISFKASMPAVLYNQFEKPFKHTPLGHYVPKPARKNRSKDELLFPMKCGGIFGSHEVHTT